MSTEEWRAKLDARTRHHLAAAGDEAGTLEILLLIAVPPSRAQLAELRAAGLRTYAAEGAVVSGAVEGVAPLRRLAGLPFVLRIELSREGHQEQGQGWA
ncbi:hypothetical protein HCN51_47695 [Nonomuraea sp. FMUSA5-5]|uniref:Uncharacterized protein n=1 Tax=Nonomuraea composti TaxID=2720023 RepID=A0ABX1BGZ9_9ACTN|nr:hypothetical protein [Nonomuraea sp. FMUSA5-5]NJP97028.1 hypothetical protein [Nonomuraea sp. FMUSA5-5]